MPCPSCFSQKVRYMKTLRGKRKIYRCLDYGFSWDNPESLIPTRPDFAENKRRMF